MTTHRHCCCEDPLAGHYGIVAIQDNTIEDTVYDLRVKSPTVHYHIVSSRDDYILPKGVTLFSEALKLPGITIITPNTNNPNVLRTIWLDHDQIKPKWNAPKYLGTSDESAVPMFTDPPSRNQIGIPNGDSVSDTTVSFFLPEQYKDYEMTQIEDYHNFLTDLNLNKQICGDCGVVQGAKFTTKKRYGIYSDLYTLFLNYIPINFLYGESLGRYFGFGIFIGGRDSNWPKLKQYLSDVLLPDDCCSPDSACVPTYVYGNTVSNKSVNVHTKAYFTPGAKELDRKIRVQGSFDNITFWQHIDSTYVGTFVSQSQGIKLYTRQNLDYFRALKCGIPDIFESVLASTTSCLPECGGGTRFTTAALFNIGAYYYFKNTLAAYYLWEDGKAPTGKIYIVRFCPVEYKVNEEIKKKIVITHFFNNPIALNSFFARSKPIPQPPNELSRAYPPYIQPVGITTEVLRVEPNPAGQQNFIINPTPCGFKEFYSKVFNYSIKKITKNTFGQICGGPVNCQVYEEIEYVWQETTDPSFDFNVFIANEQAAASALNFSQSYCCNPCEDASRLCGQDCFDDTPCGGCWTFSLEYKVEAIDIFDVFVISDPNGGGGALKCSEAVVLGGTSRICDGQITNPGGAGPIQPYPSCGGGYCNGEVTIPAPDFEQKVAQLYDRYRLVVSDIPIEKNPALEYATSNGKDISFSTPALKTINFFDIMFKKYAESYKTFYATQYGTTVNIKKYLVAYKKEEFENCQNPPCRKRLVDVLDEKQYGILYEVNPPKPGESIPGGNAEFVIEYNPNFESRFQKTLDNEYNTALLSAGHIGSFVKNVYRCSKDLNSCGNTLFNQLCSNSQACDTTIKTKYQNLCKSVIGHYGITWPKGLSGETAERETILNLTDIFPTQPLFESNITKEKVLDWCIPRQPIKDADISDIMKGLTGK